ncbi:MAG: Nif3-like dinuclear metal center hexameric protein [Clostridium sp.]|nr:Nif3-like dinuclear metal center hexameric protein [Clostridium sp.]
MTLKVRDISCIAERIAPKILCESYDNVGLMVGDLEDNVGTILAALDCTNEVIDEAISKKCNLILTHHPLLFKRPDSITTQTLLGKKIIKLVQNNINVYSMHTNLDSVKCGLNDILMDILGFKNCKILKSTNVSTSELSGKECGIGRVTELEKSIPLIELVHKVKNNLNIDSLRYIGLKDMPVKTVAVVNGSGSSFLKYCENIGADCVITGDVTYHDASDYREMNMAVIDAGHFGTEWAPFNQFASNFQNVIKQNGFENKVLISDTTFDPYKTE